MANANIGEQIISETISPQNEQQSEYSKLISLSTHKSVVESWDPKIDSTLALAALGGKSTIDRYARKTST